MGVHAWHCVCFPFSLISVPTPCLECLYASVYVLMSTWILNSAPSLHRYMEPGFTCVSLCECPSHPSCGPTPWLKCVHASVHVYMPTCLPMYALPLLHSYMQTWVSLCSTVCVFQSLYFCPHTFLECTHASVWILMSTWLSMSAPLGIVTWKHVFLGVALCVCCTHPTFGPILWLECGYASVYVYMSTWLPMSALPLLHIYKQTWVLMCVTVCASQSPWFYSHTLVKNLYVHQ